MGIRQQPPRPVARYPQQSPVAVHPSLQAIQTADIAALVDQSSAAALSEINEYVTRAGRFPIVLAIAVVLTVGTGLVAPVMLFVWAALWIIPLIVVHQLDVVARTYPMLYELDQAGTARWRALQDAATRLLTSDVIWRVDAQGHTPDYKRNVRATTILNRRVVRKLTGSPRFMACNLSTSGLDLGDQQIWFMPDRMYVYQRGRYGAVEYGALNAQLASENFIESGTVPRDATIVDSTWQYVNKNGTPDRRFASNRQIPIAQYDRLVLSSHTGLNIYTQVSRQGVSAALVHWLRSASASPAPSVSAGGPLIGSGGQNSIAASSPSAILGVTPHCSRQDAEARFRTLISNYAPDRLSHLPISFRVAGEQRLEEIQTAFMELKRSRGW